MQQKDIWLQIPPEEKFEIMAKSNSTGVFSCLCLLGMFFSIAIGLKIQWFVWLGLLTTPMVFQFSAGKAWRMEQPNLILRYLAARSVARRFAYAAKAQDLGLQLIFRGDVERVFKEEEDSLKAAFEAIESAASTQQQWIALLNSAVVIFHEARAGAGLTLIGSIDEKLEVEASNSDGSDEEYSNNREVYITLNRGLTSERRFKITSRYPAALNVFEKKLVGLKDVSDQQRKAREELQRTLIADG